MTTTSSPRPRWADVVDARVAEGYAPGMVAMAAYPDRIEVHAAGYRDLANKLPMQRDTICRLASAGKVIAAVTAMVLVEDGRVGLDEPVDRWLPELANKRVVRDLYGPADDLVPAVRPTTLRHLLSMTNGLGSYFGRTGPAPVLETPAMRDLFSGQIRSSDELMAAVAKVPLLFQPGERWTYHYGIDIAGVLVERVYGERLHDFMQRRVCAPLGMTDTGYWLTPAQAQRFARCYRGGPGQGFVEVPDRAADVTRPPPMDRGGGDLLSTADDMAKIGRLLLDGGAGVLSKATIAEMVRDQVTEEAKRNSPVFPGFWEAHGFGLGMCVARAPNRVSQRPGRYGWFGFTGTALFADPNKNVALASLTQRNIEHLDDSGNADAFMHAVLDG